MTDNMEIDDHINIKDRGDDRKVPSSGVSLYVDDGKLKAVTEDGEYTLPIDSIDTDDLENKRQWSFHFVPDYAESGDGTADNHWINGWNAALDAIPDGMMGVLVAPPGHYTCTEPVQMKRGIRNRQGLSDANDKHTMPMIMGGGRYTTSVYRADGMNDDLFVYDENDLVGENHFIIGGGMADLAILGNKANNDTGHNIVIKDPANGSGFIQHVYRDMFIRLAPEDNFHQEFRAINETEWRNVTFNRAGNRNVDLTPTDGRLSFNDCKFIFCQGPHSVRVEPSTGSSEGEVLFHGCRFRNNVNIDLLADGELVKCKDCHWVIDDPVERNDEYLILNRSNRSEMEGYIDISSDQTISDAVFVGDPTDSNYDLEIYGADNDIALSGNETRPRWRGVIGGGPLGGVDLSSTTGQFDGDLAVADGTSTASVGAWARWDDGNTQWDYIDPSGTV